ncbi:MAG: zinc-dependent alcohol dehydrogenase family protein [Gemmata sp.]
MKRVAFGQVGPPPAVLRLEDDVPAPEPKRGEVLVRMLASPVNPSDLMFVHGKYGLKPSLPATPGFEGVGVVEATGGGLLGWLRKGKRVAVINSRTGTWAEYAAVPARTVVPVPDSMADEQAACFFVNPATALAMTVDELRLRRGAWLLQSAAGGELGKMVIRLGRRFAFRTINVVRRREQVEELKTLGADHVIVEADGPIPEQVRRLVPDGVRFAIDPVGGGTGSQVIASLADGGRCLVYGSLSDEPVAVHPRQLIGNGVRVDGFWLGAWARRQRVLTMLKLFRRVRGLMAEGVLRTQFAATYPIEDAAKAAAHAAAPGKGGKVLLRIGVR